MAAKKKATGGLTYDPKLREKAVARVIAEIKAGRDHGAQARVARELGVTVSALSYWMRADFKKLSERQGAASPPAQAQPTNGNGNGHSPAKSLSDALAAYLDPLIEARLDAALSRRMQRMMEK
jgi:transposase-like protein